MPFHFTYRPNILVVLGGGRSGSMISESLGGTRYEWRRLEWGWWWDRWDSAIGDSDDRSRRTDRSVGDYGGAGRFATKLPLEEEELRRPTRTGGVMVSLVVVVVVDNWDARSWVLLSSSSSSSSLLSIRWSLGSK